MTQKIPCPQCGEPNYESSPACWACGAPLKGPRAQTPPMEEPLADEPLADEPLADEPLADEPLADEPLADETLEEAPAVEPPIVTATEVVSEAAPEAVEPPDSVSPPAAGAETPAAGTTETAAPEEAAPQGPKPAEIEAQRLREKDYVTPPVEVEERPNSLGEWFTYTLQAIRASIGGFKEALDEYDRRRGHKSGTFSSFGCLVTALTVIITIAVMAWILSFAASRLMM